MSNDTQNLEKATPDAEGARPLPCPWCGSDAVVYLTQRGEMYTIQCLNHCMSTLGPTCKTVGEAVAAWNNRDGEGRLRSELSRLKANADAALGEIRKQPHNGKIYQQDDVQYMLAWAEKLELGFASFNPQWFRDQAKLIHNTVAELSRLRPMAAGLEQAKAACAKYFTAIQQYERAIPGIRADSSHRFTLIDVSGPNPGQPLLDELRRMREIGIELVSAIEGYAHVNGWTELSEGIIEKCEKLRQALAPRDEAGEGKRK